MHTLRYAPLAKHDLSEIVTYIAVDLHAPQAALKLLKNIEEHIENLAEFPYAYPLHYSRAPLRDEFRKMPVENYLVFYVVDGLTVEVRRVLYAGRNVEQLIDE